MRRLPRSIVLALERHPAFAPASGAIVCALAMLLSPAFWFLAGALLILFALASRRLMLWFLPVCALCCFSVRTNTPRRLDKSYFYNTRSYTAVVNSVVLGANSQRLRVDIADARGAFPALLTVMDNNRTFAAGDSIAFRCCLRPQQYSGLLDVRAANRSIAVSAAALLNTEQIRVTGRSNSWRFFPQRLGERLRDGMAKTNFTDRAYALLVPSIFGLAAGPPSELASYSGAGLAHLLCVSGFHVGLIYLILSALLSPLRLWPRTRSWRPLVPLPLVWLFVFVTGASAPSVRAGVMITIVVFGLVMERGSLTLNSLYAALAVIVLCDPFSVFSVGLLFGCFAVGGLITITPVLNRCTPDTIGFTMVGWVSSALIASAATIPVQVWKFHAFPLLAFWANLLVVPLYPVFIVVGIIAVVIDGICPGFNPAIIVADWLAAYFNFITDFISSRPSAMVEGLNLSSAGLWLLFGGVLAVMTACKLTDVRKRRAGVVFGIGAALGAFAFPADLSASETIFEGDNCMVTRAGSSTLYTFRRNPREDEYTHYLMHRGIRPDSFTIVRTPELFVGPAGEEVHVVGARHVFDRNLTGQTVFIRTNSRKTLDSLLTAPHHQPQCAILSANLTPDTRRILRNHYTRCGIPVHDLWMAPLVLR